MKQVLQNLRNGATDIADVPAPRVRKGELLIRSTCSLVSPGTERMLLQFGQAGWLDKARQQPDKVRAVLEKMKTDGMLPTIATVRNKLDQPLALGYCNVGVVCEVGGGVTGFAVGDRVVSNGKHAEVVSVPPNLCALIPEGVSDEAAAFTVLAAIGLQGIRLAEPTLGESVVVTGLGLIGLLTVQLLKAQGCRVLGVDFDESRLQMARRFGAETVNASEDVVAAGYTFSRGRGIDAAIITASTSSNEPVRQAATMCRKRGRIVLVGVTGLELSRSDFYEKELTFQVSCSYGPGRYEPGYEEKGFDYPIGFVRWTEQRNFEAVLDMMADGRMNTDDLISQRFPIDDAPAAYRHVAAGDALGILLEYPRHTTSAAEEQIVLLRPASTNTEPRLAFIGAGNYATSVLIPAFRSSSADLSVIVSKNGVTGIHAARKYGFQRAGTSADEVLHDPKVDAVVITTRHDSHASFITAALGAGKHVFVEKPLAITNVQVDEIDAAYQARELAGSPALLMVGFNRRFAPHVRQIKAQLAGVREPKAFIMTVNAGTIPPSHWTQDREVGGGRIIGEACHFIDLLRFLAGAPIAGHTAVAVRGAADAPVDRVTISLSFQDGSVGTIHYLANGHKSFPKERLEVFAAGRILQLDNFRKLHAFGGRPSGKQRLWRQDKGQNACVQAFVAALKAGGPSPIPIAEILEVARVTIAIADSLH